MILSDWRDAPAADVADLYRVEHERWQAELAWDTDDSWAIVEAGRVAGHVAGWIARNGDGTVLGWTFYILHDLTLQIGGLIAQRPSVARALLDAVLGGPEASMARSLSCFIFPDCAGVSNALTRLRFSVRHTLYLAKPLTDTDAQAPPAPTARHWRDTDLVPVVRLFQAAYQGVPGAAAFAPGGLREEWAHYAAQLVHTPACGRFDPALSFCLPASGPGEGTRVAGVVLTTRLSPSTAHIAQLAVDPLQRGHRHGEALVGSVARSARVSGASMLTLMVDEGNAAARALYARAGFVERARFLSGRRGARTRVAA